MWVNGRARLSARRASRGQKGSAAREEREAQVELRWREVELADPDRQEAALKLCLVHVWEQPQPEGAERLEWFLLTTLAAGVVMFRLERLDLMGM